MRIAKIYSLVGLVVPNTNVKVISILPEKEDGNMLAEVLCLLCENFFTTRATRVAAGDVKKCRPCALKQLAEIGKEAAKNNNNNNNGSNNGMWKGGRCFNSKGYIVLSLGHGKKREEHRVVMEQMIGRPLSTNEHVHHKNGVRHDNRPENLELWIKCHPKGRRATDVLADWMDLTNTLFPDKKDEIFKIIELEHRQNKKEVDVIQERVQNGELETTDAQTIIGKITDVNKTMFEFAPGVALFISKKENIMNQNKMPHIRKAHYRKQLVKEKPKLVFVKAVVIKKS